MRFPLKLNKMKILKIENRINNKSIIVWTDSFLNIGFNFKLKDIKDKNDLISKVKLRVSQEQDKNKITSQFQSKYNLFKQLEGKSI